MACWLAAEMTIRYARETVATVIDEIQPLLRAHWAEIAQYPDIPLSPDFDCYKHLEAHGQLRIYTARHSSYALIGYAIYTVSPALHYSNSIQAKQDVLFLQPEHRAGRIGWKLIAFADELLRQDGVQVVYQHVKTDHDFGPLLERIGYRFCDKLYSRRLD